MDFGGGANLGGYGLLVGATIGRGYSCCYHVSLTKRAVGWLLLSRKMGADEWPAMLSAFVVGVSHKYIYGIRIDESDESVYFVWRLYTIEA